MLSLGTTARKCNLVLADERRVALSQLVLKFDGRVFAWYFDNPPLIPFLFRLYFYVLSFSSIKNSELNISAEFREYSCNMCRCLIITRVAWKDVIMKKNTHADFICPFS